MWLDLDAGLRPVSDFYDFDLTSGIMRVLTGSLMRETIKKFF